MSDIDYSEKIPNNVNLAEDRTLQRALEHWQPNFLDWWDDMGPEGSHELRRLPAHRGQRRPAGLGALRLREDARLPLGHLPRARAMPTRKIHFGEHKGEPAWQDVPGEHRANLRRIIVTQGDTEPASVEQQRHLGPHRAVAVRPAQPVPGQRRGRPPPVGDGLPAAQATSAATAARKPRRCSSAARATRTTRASSAPSTSRRPTGSRFFMFTYFTDRDGKFQLCALAEIGLRSAGAHDEVHADRGSAPHVRGRVRRLARDPAHLRGDERARRPTIRQKVRAAGAIDLPTHPALPQLPLQRDDRPVRRRPVEQRGDVLQLGPEGPLRGRQARRRPRAASGQTYKVLEVQDGQLVEKEVPMLNALNEVLRDDFIKDSIAGVGRWNKVHREGRHAASACTVPHKAFNRQHRHARRHASVSPDGRVVERGRMEGAARREWLPTRGGPRLRRVADGPRRRTRQVRRTGSRRRRSASTGSRSISSTSASAEADRRR